MSQDIDLFNNYNQKENRVTNYSLLILKLLYKESPGLLGEFLSGFLPPNVNINTEPTFRQQEVSKGSVVDGFIYQESFSLIIETKSYDWFYNDQIDRHIGNRINKEDNNTIFVALSNFEENKSKIISNFEKLKRKKSYKNVTFCAMDFSEFVNGIRDVSKAIQSLSLYRLL